MYVNWAQTMNLDCIHVWNGKLYNLIHSLVHPFNHSYLLLFFLNLVTSSIHFSFSFVVVQLLSRVWPLHCVIPGFPVHYLPEFAQTHAHWVGDAISTITFCHSLLLLPSIFPSIRVFSNESVFATGAQRISISPSYEYSGLISFRIDWSPCSPRDSQESSPASQFKGIHYLPFCLLYGPALTTVHDHWEDQSLDCIELCQQSNVSAFQHTV